MGNVSSKVAVAVGLLTGGFFLWLAVRNVELAAVAASLKSANIWLGVPFLVLFGLFYWLKAIRWAMLLRPTQCIAARELVPAMMIGFAGNNVLPIRLGELLRIYALGKEKKIPKSTVLGTIVLERIFDLVSVLVLLTVAMYSTPFASADFEAARTFILIAAIGAVGVAYGIAISPLWLTSLTSRVFGLLPYRIRKRANRKLAELRQGFAVLIQSPGHTVLRLSMNSLAQWALLAACIYIAIMAFDVKASPSTAVMILGLLVAGISLPAAPGFVGTIEYCFVLGLGLFGVGAEKALSVGIYYHAITFLSVTLSGAFYLRRYNTSMWRFAARAAEVKNYDNEPGPRQAP